MDKYTRAFLTVIALCMLALPVRAGEKVWSCEIVAAVSTNKEGIRSYEPEKEFEIQATPHQVVGISGFLIAWKMDVDFRLSDKFWNARNKESVMYFRDGILNFGSANSKSAEAISALCDDL